MNKVIKSEVQISRVALNDMVPFASKNHRPRTTYRSNNTIKVQEDNHSSTNKVGQTKKNVFVLKNMDYLNDLTPKKFVELEEERAKRRSQNQLNLANKIYNNNYK